MGPARRPGRRRHDSFATGCRPNVVAAVTKPSDFLSFESSPLTGFRHASYRNIYPCIVYTANKGRDGRGICPRRSARPRVWRTFIRGKCLPGVSRVARLCSNKAKGTGVGEGRGGVPLPQRRRRDGTNILTFTSGGADFSVGFGRVRLFMESRADTPRVCLSCPFRELARPVGILNNIFLTRARARCLSTFERIGLACERNNGKKFPK